MKKYISTLIAALVVAFLGAGAYYWSLQLADAPVAIPDVVAPPIVSPMPESPMAAASAPAEPGILYPLEAQVEEPAMPAPALPSLAEADAYVQDALVEWLGRKDVSTFLQIDGFIRRVVATVDNLARSHAARSLWPVNPTPGRFTTRTQSGSNTSELTIDPDNGLRYSPLVQFIESVDSTQAVRFYKRLYPLFQQAYEELGYPGRYFNDRMVAVIDHLMAAPIQTGPLAVTLVEVKGSVPSLRPWVRYEFVDPGLESLSAGQKMLVRSGPVNHRRLRTKLAEIRPFLAGVLSTRVEKPRP